MGYTLQVMPESPQPHRIEQAAKLLSKGQVAAVSTDTGFSLVAVWMTRKRWTKFV